MAYYKDLREYIDALEWSQQLVRIRREINKDTELMPLVRWQYRGLHEQARKAFLFEKVFDVKGKRYDIPVLTACYAGTRMIYALGMMCEPDKIMEKWAKAHGCCNRSCSGRGIPGGEAPGPWRTGQAPGAYLNAGV
jgi:4-hydroxy-3-polyprenylbenzoate decarboxylase